MDPLSAVRRAARERRALLLAIAIPAVLAALLRARDEAPAPAVSPADSDAGVAAALAREAMRALREGPQRDPAPLAPEGLRELAARRPAPDPPDPAAQYRPRAIELRATQRPERPPLPGVGADRTAIARVRPARAGDPRVRFVAGDHGRAPTAPR